MSDLLIQKIKEYVELKDEDFLLLEKYFQKKTMAKGDFLFREGDAVHHAIFVNSGLIRTFIIDEQGTEHILQFALPGWWTGDLGSFISGATTKFFVEALENSEVLSISKQSWDELLDKAPFYLDYHRKLLERGLVAIQNRLLETFSTDASQKYQQLMETFPDILQRVPLYMIASYLGMSRETLSRVRNQMVKKKTN
ncbi:MAG: Crp/Fnr family transcriptional regulator [Ignavibacteriota bacterium]|nr:Crp/Fnr family transcriptional regulator [Ignavibacterium sp.]MCO6446566.1 Crp/Fnr family transcriptional regulator [Ignavibacterium album]MCZ2268675.1 Crp/Fnr family transcriptional regulator [Ignavibacteriales bacterium]QKK00598.1 MAG: Crp/Fnr family transcriptional regulator [Ignavibacteriota bacterium]HOJ08188.1 Crp/Fnr family transcriptional regulator [Ignavibacteriaceae bacterium]